MYNPTVLYQLDFIGILRKLPTEGTPDFRSGGTPNLEGPVTASTWLQSPGGPRGRDVPESRRHGEQVGTLRYQSQKFVSPGVSQVTLVWNNYLPV